MTIISELEGCLYINLTNKCTNKCTFCIRNTKDSIGNSGNLWLEKEPSYDEIIKELNLIDLSKYKEIVFCGYGEPMFRLNDIIDISKFIKKNYKVPIRINTNGHANLIHKKDITYMLENLIDSISISLNAKNSKQYEEHCIPVFGDKTYNEVLDFAIKCKKYIPKVTLSVVNIISDEDIKECEKIVNDIGGIDFKVRKIL